MGSKRNSGAMGLGADVAVGGFKRYRRAMPKPRVKSFKKASVRGKVMSAANVRKIIRESREQKTLQSTQCFHKG